MAKYQHSDWLRSVWQVVNTLVPYFVLWYVMLRSLEFSYRLTLALSIIAAGFLIGGIRPPQKPFGLNKHWRFNK